MKKILLLLVVGLAFVAQLSFSAEQAKDLKAFPEAEEGYERYVFRLPELEDEYSSKVSIVVGKRMMTDGVNQHGLSGTIKRVTIPGWGYSYYKVESKGQMFGTLMAAPEGAPKVEKFVQLRSDMGPQRYNSKLPVVVIAPEGFEVKYRIWTAGELQAAAKE